MPISGPPHLSPHGVKKRQPRYFHTSLSEASYQLAICNRGTVKFGVGEPDLVLLVDQNIKDHNNNFSFFGGQIGIFGTIVVPPSKSQNCTSTLPLPKCSSHESLVKNNGHLE